MRPLSPWWGEGKARNLNCQILKAGISNCHAQIIRLSEFGRYVVSEPPETQSPMLNARFLHLTILVAQPQIEPPDLCTTRPSV